MIMKLMRIDCLWDEILNHLLQVVLTIYVFFFQTKWWLRHSD